MIESRAASLAEAPSTLLAPAVQALVDYALTPEPIRRDGFRGSRLFEAASSVALTMIGSYSNARPLDLPSDSWILCNLLKTMRTGRTAGRAVQLA